MLMIFHFALSYHPSLCHSYSAHFGAPSVMQRIALPDR